MITLPKPEELSRLDLHDPITRDWVREMRRMARASLFFFAKYVFGHTGLNERAHKSLCDFAQSVIVAPNGFGVCEDPRGTGKSNAVTIPGPAWCLIQDPKECTQRGWLPLGPSTNIMVASYKKPFAMIFVDETRRRIEEQPLFGLLFGDLIPERSNVPWSKEFFTVNRTSGSGYSVIAVGTESSSTSLHPYVLFIDDLINEINWKSTVEVASQVEWMEHSENLVEITKGSRIVTQNEWTERGVNAALREMNVKTPNSIRFFSRSRIVCDICENGRPVDLRGNPIPDGEGFQHPAEVRPILDHFTTPPFGPYTLDDVRRLKAKMNSTMWWAQHENNPLAKAERRWRMDWIRWYNIVDDPAGSGKKMACLLTGVGGLSGNAMRPDPERLIYVDFSSMDVCVALDPGIHHPGIAATGRILVPQIGDMLFILDCSTRKLSTRDQFFLMFEWLLKWNARKIVFEKTGLTGYIESQIPALADAYQRERGMSLPHWVTRPNPTANRIVGVPINTREGDKVMRLDQGISPFAEQRLIACRKDIVDFTTEYEIFDKGKYMDGLDAVFMAIKAYDGKRKLTAEQEYNIKVRAVRDKELYEQEHSRAIGYGEY